MTRLVLIAAAALALSACAREPAPTRMDAFIPGEAVTLTGEVAWYMGRDEFMLNTGEGPPLPVYVGDVRGPAAVGERVTVSGFRDAGPLREIYALEIVTADGRVVTFDPPGA